MYLPVFVGFHVLCVCRIVNSQLNSYRAAVVEYAPHAGTKPFMENWQINLGEYLRYIEDASNQRADIIVFPEAGLSGMNVTYHDIEASSTEVPDPNQHVLPCNFNNNANYTAILRELSCSARNNNIYVVVNLNEKQNGFVGSKKNYYNTNIVFNRRGEIIARHRKINMYNEPHYTPGKEVTTFTTDFGVTFGMFICADILFKTPAQELLLKHNVTDVIFSAAWFSELPTYQSLSVQHGYAKANGVNLLAAGLNNPKEKNGGSGIYLADGRIADAYISGTKMSKLIVQDVHKINTKTPNSSCKFQKSSGSYKWGPDPFAGQINDFNTGRQDLHDYTFKNLNVLGQRSIEDTVCSGTSSFCCTFNVTISRTNNIIPNYIYKMAIFQGAWATTSSVTIGVRNCLIVACTNENNDSCGDRNAVAPRGVRFEKILVRANVDNKEAWYQPASVTFDLKPVSDYTYCVNEVDGDKSEVSMETTDSIDHLLSFGLTGRVLKYDNQPAGLINDSVINRGANVLYLFILSIVYSFCFL